MENKFLRNKDLIPQEKLDDITVVGLGGIGSSLVMLLATMGFKSIKGYDMDHMQEHNFGTTLYPESWYDPYKENSKASYAEKLAKSYGGSRIACSFRCEEFTEDTNTSNKTIVCTDNMNSRKTVYNSWLKNENREVFIDLRMDALSMTCVTITKDSDVYMKHWFPEGESGEPAPCTMKHTIFSASTISALGVAQLFNYLTYRPFHQYIGQSLSPLNIVNEDFYCGEISK